MIMVTSSGLGKGDTYLRNQRYQERLLAVRDQLIPDHKNPQKRQTKFGSYLFEYGRKNREMLPVI